MDEVVWWHGAVEWVFRHGDLASGVVMFFFGLAAGSFLNVVVCRLPHGLSLLWPSSACPRCGNGIRLRDNIPVLGWLLLRGRCRDCGLPIAWRYPAVELLTGLLWGAAAYAQVGGGWMDGPWERSVLLLAQLLALSALVVVTCIDFDYQIIPDPINYGGMAASLALAAGCPGWALGLSPEFAALFPAVGPRAGALLASLTGLATGVGLMGMITVAGTLALRKKIKELQKGDPELDTAIGLGDLKLMAFIGAFLGWRGCVGAFFLGVLYGAVKGAWDKWRSGAWPRDKAGRELRWTGEACLSRWRSGISVMALGPFLSLGAATMLFFHAPLTKFMAGLLMPPG